MDHDTPRVTWPGDRANDRKWRHHSWTTTGSVGTTRSVSWCSVRRAALWKWSTGTTLLRIYLLVTGKVTAGRNWSTGTRCSRKVEHPFKSGTCWRTSTRILMRWTVSAYRPTTMIFDLDLTLTFDLCRIVRLWADDRFVEVGDATTWSCRRRAQFCGRIIFCRRNFYRALFSGMQSMYFRSKWLKHIGGRPPLKLVLALCPSPPACRVQRRSRTDTLPPKTKSRRTPPPNHKKCVIAWNFRKLLTEWRITGDTEGNMTMTTYTSTNICLVWISVNMKDTRLKRFAGCLFIRNFLIGNFACGTKLSTMWTLWLNYIVFWTGFRRHQTNYSWASLCTVTR